MYNQLYGIRFFTLFLIMTLSFCGFSQIDNSIYCDELSRSQQEINKRNKVKSMTSIIISTYNSSTKKNEEFPKKNNVEVIHEFDTDGKLMNRKIRDYGDEMAVINYEYDNFGRETTVTSESSVFNFVLSNVYADDSTCMKKYSTLLLEEDIIDSIVYNYEEKKVYLNSYSERNGEVLNVYQYNEQNLISDDGDFMYEYQFNADGFLLKRVKINKETKEKDIVINEYKNGLLVKVKNYINEQLMQVNEVHYKYY